MAYLRDTSSRATFSIAVDRRDPQSGLVVLGIPSLGLLRTASSATMDSHDDGSIEVRYGGIGDLDREAQLDLDYGVAVRSSGSSDKVELTIRATIGPDLRTGSVTVTVAGHRYVITDRAPTESAQATLNALAIATRKQDWRAWYGLLSSTVTRSMSEADWVSQMRSGVESSGRVVAAEAGGVTYRSDAYLDFASAPFTITLEKDGARRQLDYAMTLVWERAGWRFVTTTPLHRPERDPPRRGYEAGRLGRGRREVVRGRSMRGGAAGVALTGAGSGTRSTLRTLSAQSTSPRKRGSRRRRGLAQCRKGNVALTVLARTGNHPDGECGEGRLLEPRADGFDGRRAVRRDRIAQVDPVGQVSYPGIGEQCSERARCVCHSRTLPVGAQVGHARDTPRIHVPAGF